MPDYPVKCIKNGLRVYAVHWNGENDDKYQQVDAEDYEENTNKAL
jgi:hypothetical protein